MHFISRTHLAYCAFYTLHINFVREILDQCLLPDHSATETCCILANLVDLLFAIEYPPSRPSSRESVEIVISR